MFVIIIVIKYSLIIFIALSSHCHHFVITLSSLCHHFIGQLKKVQHKLFNNIMRIYYSTTSNKRRVVWFRIFFILQRIFPFLPLSRRIELFLRIRFSCHVVSLKKFEDVRHIDKYVIISFQQVLKFGLCNSIYVDFSSTERHNVYTPVEYCFELIW